MTASSLQLESKVDPISEQAFKKSKSLFPMGGDNYENANECLGPRIDFYRALQDHAFTCITTQTDFDKLLEQIIVAILTEAAMCGNCYEQSSCVLVEHWKAGNFRRLEKISVTNQTNISHCAVIKDRDEKTNSQDPSSWEKITLIDTWGSKDGIICHFETASIELAHHLTAEGIIKEPNYDIEACIDHPMTAKESERVAIFLKQLQEYFTIEIIFNAAVSSQYCMKLDLIGETDLCNELTTIKDTLTQHIKYYTEKTKELTASVARSPFALHGAAVTSSTTLSNLTQPLSMTLNKS